MVPGTVLGKVLGTNITGAFFQTWHHGTYCPHSPLAGRVEQLVLTVYLASDLAPPCKRGFMGGITDGRATPPNRKLTSKHPAGPPHVLRLGPVQVWMQLLESGCLGSDPALCSPSALARW